jgi:ubiquitin C-terminal hydrolase
MRSVKRTVLADLPNTLIVQLKRFDFDYENMEKHKLYDRFEFPVDELGVPAARV